MYGPNNYNPSFSRHLFLTLAKLPGSYIIGGDFNCTLKPEIDRSTGVDASHNQAFDRMEWQYLFDVIKIFGIKGKFLSWIRLLYADPQAI